MAPASGSRPVYSTDGGRIPVKSTASLVRAAGDGIIRISRDGSGRGGKVVTVIRGFLEGGGTLEDRAAELRRLCGAGGTVRADAVEIQGDHRERVAEHLRGLGYTVKLAGG